MRRRFAAMVCTAVLFVFALACGGGGGGNDGEPGFRFRSLTENQTAAAGQYVLVWGTFSNVPSTAAWTVFFDIDEDYDNGRTDVTGGGDTGYEVLKLWDTTGVPAGTYHVGVAVALESGTLAFYAPGVVEVTAGAPPVITIVKPDAATEYARGDAVPLEAEVDQAGYSWELFAGFAKDPLVRAVNIAALPADTHVAYSWDTSSVDPGSYYIGFLVRRGDVWTYAFTDFLITIAVHDKWVPVSMNDAPEAREDHRAVWTGTEMIVWGGKGTGGSLITGGRYTPWSDSWQAMSIESAPAARYDFTATWCGDRLIVWGGRTATGFTNLGSAYFPAEDRWEPISTDGAPAPRANHTAVWTGGRLVVWGGEGLTGYFDDGGIYDPATDSWTPIPSAADSPAARREHTAVWTGGGMIVWGGRNDAPMQDGAYWDAATGSWTPISETGAPSARWDHYAAYLPTLGMVIWGGRDGFNPLADGAVYDPATDSWTAMGTTDGPLPAYDPQIVLCGRKLFVWGGYDYGYRTVAHVYDFDAGIWTAASTEDEPVSRMLGTAVWTGGVVIVWGGRTVGGLTQTGGYYFLP